MVSYENNLLMHHNTRVTSVLAAISLLCLLLYLPLSGQDQSSPGRFSGDIQFNGRVFATDSAIGAANTPFYDWAKSSSESWLQLNYSQNSLEMGVRFDMYNNSDIFSGGVTEANGIGIGRWFVKKRVDNFTFEGGYIYDQFGSGSILRAYEARALGIDNPIVGVKGTYDLNEHIRLKGIAGKQKDVRSFISKNRQFINTYSPYIKGLNAEGNWSVNKINFSPGLSFMNRTIDEETMATIATEINGQGIDTRFVPKYNLYAYSFYNTVNFKNWSLFLEYAGKSEDVLRDYDNSLYNSTGNMMYGTLSYSQKGFGISLAVKKLNDFDIRTSPLEQLTSGLVNFLPPQMRQNSLRLVSRYNHATQPLDELSYMLDVVYTPKKGITMTGTYANAENEDELLFREIYFDIEFKRPKKKWKIMMGLQLVDYNIAVLQAKPLEGDDRFVDTFTPFTEFTYKFTRRKSMRVELQYLLTERDRVLLGSDKEEHLQDLGDWAYALVEFNFAPKYSISISDMYAIDGSEHYYDLSASYTKGANRFSIGWAKQVEGIICTGGICRPESAFSGLKMGISSTF